MTSKAMLIVGLLSLLCASILCVHKDAQPKRDFTLYQMEIIDEHEVRLTTENDTLILSFENAYALAGQDNGVFVTE